MSSALNKFQGNPKILAAELQGHKITEEYPSALKRADSLIVVSDEGFA